MDYLFMFFCTVHYLIYYFIFCLVLPGRGPAVRHVEEDRDEEQSADNRRSGKQKGGVHRRICQIYAPGKSIDSSVHRRICQIYTPGKSIDLSVHHRICQIYTPGKSIELSVPRQICKIYAPGKSLELSVHPQNQLKLRFWKKYRFICQLQNQPTFRPANVIFLSNFQCKRRLFARSEIYTFVGTAKSSNCSPGNTRVIM
jgi:hypothetical protein